MHSLCIFLGCWPGSNFAVHILELLLELFDASLELVHFECLEIVAPVAVSSHSTSTLDRYGRRVCIKEHFDREFRGRRPLEASSRRLAASTSLDCRVLGPSLYKSNRERVGAISALKSCCQKKLPYSTTSRTQSSHLFISGMLLLLVLCIVVCIR